MEHVIHCLFYSWLLWNFGSLCFWLILLLFCFSREYNWNFNGEYIKFVGGFNQYGHLYNRIFPDAWTCGVFLPSNDFCSVSVFTVEILLALSDLFLGCFWGCEWNYSPDFSCSVVVTGVSKTFDFSMLTLCPAIC